jgi:hypothetical protein
MPRLNSGFVAAAIGAVHAHGLPDALVTAPLTWRRSGKTSRALVHLDNHSCSQTDQPLPRSRQFTATCEEIADANCCTCITSGKEPVSQLLLLATACSTVQRCAPRNGISWGRWLSATSAMDTIDACVVLLGDFAFHHRSRWGGSDPAATVAGLERPVEHARSVVDEWSQHREMLLDPSTCLAWWRRQWATADTDAPVADEAAWATFVVSGPRTTDVQQVVIEQFERAGVDYNGGRLSVVVAPREILATLQRHVNVSDLGAAMSHAGAELFIELFTFDCDEHGLAEQVRVACAA